MTDLRHSDVPGLPGDLQRRVRAWALEVIARTGCRVYYNAIFRSVTLCLRDAAVGVASFELFRGGVLSLPTTDAACERVYSGRMSKALKDAIIARSAHERKAESRRRVERSIEDRRPETKKTVQKFLRNRKTFSVSGTGASNG